MIAGAAVPAIHPGIRTQLHQAEGRGGTRIGVAVETGSVENVHGINRRFGGICAAERHRKKKDKELIYFHICQDDLCS